MVGEAWNQDAVHRARQSVGEWVLRELQRQASRRVSEARDFLQLTGGTGRDRSMEGPLQSRSAALLLGLPTPCTHNPTGHRHPPTHTNHYAVVSLNPVQNPGQSIYLSAASSSSHILALRDS